MDTQPRNKKEWLWMYDLSAHDNCLRNSWRWIRQ